MSAAGKLREVPTPTPRRSRCRKESARCAVHGGEEAQVQAKGASAAPATATTNLVRRNSSGYCSGSASNSRSNTLNSGAAAPNPSSSPAATSELETAVRNSVIAKKNSVVARASTAGIPSSIAASTSPPPSASSGAARRSSVMMGKDRSPASGIGAGQSAVTRRSSVCVVTSANYPSSSFTTSNSNNSSGNSSNVSIKPQQQDKKPESQQQQKHFPSSPSVQTRSKSATVQHQQAPPAHHHKTSRLNLGSLFGSSNKRNSAHGHSGSGQQGGVGVQGKIAKRYERQTSSGQQQQQQDEVDKRALFVQAGRSSTGLNLFGARRRSSIAITDDAYCAAMRSAKSHVDLSQVGAGGSPATPRRPVGPGLSELREEKRPSPSSSVRAAAAGLGEGVASRLARIGGNLRSWAELEKMWVGRAKEAPNIEGMFKPRSSFRTDGGGSKAERSARAKTIPMTGGEGAPPPLGQQQQRGKEGKLLYQQHHNSSGNWSPPAFSSRQHRQQVAATSSASSTPPAGSPRTSRLTLPNQQQQHASIGGTTSPGVARKAIDLLAPHIFSAWQREQGYPPVYQRYSSMPPQAAARGGAARRQGHLAHSRSHDGDHFEQLVRAW